MPNAQADIFSEPERSQTHTTPDIEEKEDEDVAFMKVAEAGQKILKIYRQLHRKYLVNSPYVSTHHLFTAGKNILGIFNNTEDDPDVRRNLFSLCDLALTTCSKPLNVGRY
jgi:hypothetical protein